MFTIFAISLVPFFLFHKKIPPLSYKPQIPEKVLICGVGRNIEKAVPNTARSIQNLGEKFLDYRAIIYENNSTDDTKRLFRKAAQDNPRILFLSEQLSKKELSRKLPEITRTTKIARARNIVLNVANLPAFQDYKYVIWADLDFLEPWDVNAITETILHPQEEWDAVFAYGAYDLFALRSEKFPIGYELLGEKYWDYIPQLKTAFSLDTNGPWEKVYSAFGGFGIYKKEAIKDCLYSGSITEDLQTRVAKWLYAAEQNPNTLLLKEWEELPQKTLHGTCEHIPFHASMIAKGKDKLFINPKIHSAQ